MSKDLNLVRKHNGQSISKGEESERRKGRRKRKVKNRDENNVGLPQSVAPPVAGSNTLPPFPH